MMDWQLRCETCRDHVLEHKKRFTDDRTLSGGIDERGAVIQWPQIILNGLPKRLGKEEFEKNFLHANKIYFRKLKVIPQKTFCFIVFEDEKQMQSAISLLAQLTYRGHKVCAL